MDPYSNNSCIDENKAKTETDIYKEKYHVKYSCQASIYYARHDHMISRALFVHEGLKVQLVRMSIMNKLGPYQIRIWTYIKDIRDKVRFTIERYWSIVCSNS